MSEEYQETTRTENGAVRLTVDQNDVMITKLAGDHPDATVAMTRRQAKELLQLLIEGLAQTDNEQDPDELIGDFAALYTLLLSLDTLREIETEDIPEDMERWQEAMEAGNQAQEALAQLVEDAFEEFSEHNDRALMLDEEEDELPSEDPLDEEAKNRAEGERDD